MSSSHFNELQPTDISSQTKEILSEDYFSKMKGPLQNLQPKFTRETAEWLCILSTRFKGYLYQNEQFSLI